MTVFFEFELAFELKKTQHRLMIECHEDNNRNMINYIQENTNYDLKEFLQVLSYALVHKFSLNNIVTNKDSIIVDFTRLVQNYLYNDTETKKDEKRFMAIGLHWFLEPMIFPIKLCPIDPFFHLKQTNTNNTRFIANIESLENFKMVNHIDVIKIIQ